MSSESEGSWNDSSPERSDCRKLQEEAKKMNRPTEEEARRAFLSKYAKTPKDEISDSELERRAEEMMAAGDSFKETPTHFLKVPPQIYLIIHMFYVSHL